MRKVVIGMGLALAAFAGVMGCSVSESSSRQQAASSSQEKPGASSPHASHETAAKDATAPSQASHAGDAATGHEGHAHGATGTGEYADPYRVPAFEIDAASLNNLLPTLSPDKFTGKQRLGYQAVKEIPKTIAQLPCYCYCDQGFGHKSLHSCFVDDHAAHCGVCVDEALLALKLQKEDGLKPEQVRARIIEIYGPKRTPSKG